MCTRVHVCVCACVLLRMGPRTLHVVGKCFTVEPYPSPTISFGKSPPRTHTQTHTLPVSRRLYVLCLRSIVTVSASFLIFDGAKPFSGFNSHSNGVIQLLQLIPAVSCAVHQCKLVVRGGLFRSATVSMVSVLSLELLLTVKLVVTATLKGFRITSEAPLAISMRIFLERFNCGRETHLNVGSALHGLVVLS